MAENRGGGGCCPPMDLMRSEPMQLVQVIVPMESAHLTVSYLGDLGLVQFKNVNFMEALSERNFDEAIEHRCEFLPCHRFSYVKSEENVGMDLKVRAGMEMAMIDAAPKSVGSFNEEKFLDQHFATRHYNLLNTTGTKCLADLCGALHCDFVLSSKKAKSKCNPAAAAKNSHLCENVLCVSLLPSSLVC
ncbi:hypothetical protein HID58_046244 [Brassica napus]|uniref:Uncharacterized protein n=1 Tax=Brassica napus TaxID=3708 RepID=A0ABQ8AX99_BRANA|nr:hypothetical protein HID58_046244 [Brassica napus]